MSDNLTEMRVVKNENGHIKHNFIVPTIYRTDVESSTMFVSLLRPVVISHLMTSPVVMRFTARNQDCRRNKTLHIALLTSHSYYLELWLLGDACFGKISRHHNL